MNPKRSDTGKYEVRWREGSRHRSRSFTRKKDADDFRAQMRINKQRRGILTIESGGATVADLGMKVWEQRWSKLAPKTKNNYALIWDVHVVRYIGDREIDMLTPFEIEDWLTKLELAGTGRESQRRALKLVKYAFKCAMHWQMIASNPADLAPIPGKPDKRPIRPATPDACEALRAQLLSAGRPVDALRVSVLYGAGLRVGETTRTDWEDFADRTMMVWDTKRKTFRVVDLEPVILKEIAEVKLITPNATGRAFAGDGNNWRNRVYLPAASDADLDICPPKDLRHTRVSMLLHAHESIAYIADQLGHSPEMTVGNYTHLIRELRGSERTPANEIIVRARYAAVESKGAKHA